MRPLLIATPGKPFSNLIERVPTHRLVRSMTCSQFFLIKVVLRNSHRVSYIQLCSYATLTCKASQLNDHITACDSKKKASNFSRENLHTNISQIIQCHNFIWSYSIVRYSQNCNVKHFDFLCTEWTKLFLLSQMVWFETRQPFNTLQHKHMTLCEFRKIDVQFFGKFEQSVFPKSHCVIWLYCIVY